MTYGIMKTYIFTQAGQEAARRGMDWQQILQKRYEGIYYNSITEITTSKMQFKYDEIKKEFQKDRTFRKGSKDLEDIVEAKPQRRYVSTEAKHRPRDKKYHSQS